MNTVGAICVLSDEGLDTASVQNYKILFTRSCMSQIRKQYKSSVIPVTIHLYKYGTRADLDKISEMLNSNIVEKNTYRTCLDHILECFMRHFESNFEGLTDACEN